MPIEVGDRVRLDLTLDGGDCYAKADGLVGEVVPSDRGGEHTHLVRVDVDDESVDILVADHELHPVAEVSP